MFLETELPLDHREYNFRVLINDKLLFKKVVPIYASLPTLIFFANLRVLK